MFYQEAEEFTEESVSTALLKKGIEVAQLQEALRQCRYSFAGRMKKCEQQEKEIEARVIIHLTVVSCHLFSQ